MANKAQRIFYTVDPLDVWVRVTVLAEKYGEPDSSLRDFIVSAKLSQRWRGGVQLINERHYQDALEALPHQKPDLTKKEQTEKGDGDKKGGRGRDARVDREESKRPTSSSGEVAVPGVAGRRPRVRAQLRLQEGGV